MKKWLTIGVLGVLVIGALSVVMIGTAFAQDDTTPETEVPKVHFGLEFGMDREVGLEAAAGVATMVVKDQTWTPAASPLAL